MSASNTLSLTWPRLLAFGLVVALLGALGGWLASRATMGDFVRDYVVEHPEMLPEAMDNLKLREDAAQLAGVREDVTKPWPGAVLGNPNGSKVMVEFADYACGYCRESVEAVDQLIEENPDLKVVVRELPILSQGSLDAAKMALAAAEQGKYPAFHRAMYEIGKPDAQSIEAAARAAGLDLDRARQTIAQPRIEEEIGRNMAMAQRLGFQCTPSWVIGDQLLSGAVGKDKLGEAIAKIGA
jgi:protein-disulfide isomerase